MKYRQYVKYQQIDVYIYQYEISDVFAFDKMIFHPNIIWATLLENLSSGFMKFCMKQV